MCHLSVVTIVVRYLSTSLPLYLTFQVLLAAPYTLFRTAQTRSHCSVPRAMSCCSQKRWYSSVEGTVTIYWSGCRFCCACDIFCLYTYTQCGDWFLRGVRLTRATLFEVARFRHFGFVVECCCPLTRKRRVLPYILLFLTKTIFFFARTTAPLIGLHLHYCIFFRVENCCWVRHLSTTKYYKY